MLFDAVLEHHVVIRMYNQKHLLAVDGKHQPCELGTGSAEAASYRIACAVLPLRFSCLVFCPCRWLGSKLLSCRGEFSLSSFLEVFEIAGALSRIQNLRRAYRHCQVALYPSCSVAFHPSGTM